MWFVSCPLSVVTDAKRIGKYSWQRTACSRQLFQLGTRDSFDKLPETSSGQAGQVSTRHRNFKKNTHHLIANWLLTTQPIAAGKPLPQ